MKAMGWLALLLFLGLLLFWPVFTQETFNGTVTDKYSQGNQVYFYTVQKDGGEIESFENQNSMYLRKSNAATIERMVQAGGSYSFTVVGVVLPGLPGKRVIMSVNPL